MWNHKDFWLSTPYSRTTAQFHSTETYKRGDWQEGNVARWLRAWALTDRPGFVSGRRLHLSELQFLYLQNGDITTHCIGPLWEWNEIMLVKKLAQVYRKRRILGVVWVGGKRRTQNWSPNLWFQHKANYFLISSNSLFLTGNVRRVLISLSPPGRQGEHAGGGKHLGYPSLLKNEQWVRLMGSGILQIAFYFLSWKGWELGGRIVHVNLKFRFLQKYMFSAGWPQMNLSLSQLSFGHQVIEMAT